MMIPCNVNWTDSFIAPSALCRALKRFQLRDDNDGRPINPLAIYLQ